MGSPEFLAVEVARKLEDGRATSGVVVASDAGDSGLREGYGWTRQTTGRSTVASVRLGDDGDEREELAGVAAAAEILGCGHA